MSNLSQEKRQEMLDYIAQLKEIHNDDESIIALNNIENALTEKKYGLVWEEHSEKVDEMLEHHIPVFEEVKERKIEANPEAGFNFLLEGDNLHSLKLLEKTHQGKIDVIYIDPPYNTKNKEFIYNDKKIGEDDGYRHSKWLSFMHERLQIAKDLLDNNGVIFISIDDNEQAQLKLLCDEIFGEFNSIGPIIQNKLNSKNDTLNVQKNHEYVLVYRKMQLELPNGKSKPTIVGKSIKERDIISEQGEYFYLSDPLTTRGEGGTLRARPNLGYSVYYNEDNGNFIGVKDYKLEETSDFTDEFGVYQNDKELIKKGYTIIRPPKVRGELGAWTWDLNKFNSSRKNIYIKKKKDGFSVHRKIRVDKNKVIEKGKRLIYLDYKDSNINSIVEYSTNEGTKTLNSILEGNNFNNPKNLDLIKYIISLKDTKNSVVLDFFAGSGTTGHAVMQLNKEDGGNRRYILCTNNENNICEEITYQRLKNIQEELPHNLKYYKTDFIDKLDEDEDILSSRLLDHIKEMVELENMCEIDGVNRVLVLTEDDLDKWLTSDIQEGASLYLPSYILLSREEEELCQDKNVTIINIPDYYFLDELREAREL